MSDINNDITNNLSFNTLSSNVQTFFTAIIPALTTIDQLLDAYQGDSNMQIKELIKFVNQQMEWSEKQAKDMEWVIQAYIRNHPLKFVKRGVNGGIADRAQQEKKAQAQVAKAQAKQQVAQALEQELERKKALLNSGSQE